ncbi:GAS2 domain protein [Aspergillus saccharolyticus JOP 1030-1]|uniref:GAR domain-containing protein n=1 Tax=Aspergillus saccharolyticus JOP 1030-1 TaxID=1450539 RepID=A0A318ZKR1_9EURO|nr:hypothetical protein BP01DRAFT_177095 [Aspergillus saccharolyticus JOP 1030-1]PYH48159.1 hypothetical protein BP01DRAFT_177095 [Aspergillus saccharolyticus JOP 1030-1]
MASSRVTPRPTPVHHTHPPRSRSPDRPIPDYEHIDPLLGSLSPESTLRALTSTNAVPKNEKVAHDILSQSIAQVSPAERALAIRAAVVAQKLNLWYKEIQSWSWPKHTDEEKGLGFTPPSDPTNEEYYGSLPAAVVEEHEKRIEEIRDEMDVIDMDELKEHVLNAHIPARSRPSSANSSLSVPPTFSYVQLSDFTAVITATILRALPLLSRLTNLLSIWNVRLLVLRQIPGLLHSLRLARSELEAALDLLKASEPPSEKDPLFSRANYHATRAQLEATVVSAGRRLDCVLDALDDCEDSIPDCWIDDLESIESEFGTWTMQAEQRTVDNEWQRVTAIAQKDVYLDTGKDTSDQLSIDDIRDEDRSLASSGPVVQTGHSFPMETIDEEETSTPVQAKLDDSGQDELKIPDLPTIMDTTSADIDDTTSSAVSDVTNMPAALTSSNATATISQTSIDSISCPVTVASSTTSLDQTEAVLPLEANPSTPPVVVSLDKSQGCESQSDEEKSHDEVLRARETPNGSCGQPINSQMAEQKVPACEDITSPLEICSGFKDSARSLECPQDSRSIVDHRDMLSSVEEAEVPRHTQKSTCLSPPEDNLQPPNSPQTDTGSVIIRRHSSVSMSPQTHVKRGFKPEEVLVPHTTNPNGLVELVGNLPSSLTLDEATSLANDAGQHELTEATGRKSSSLAKSVSALSNGSLGTSAESVIATSDEHVPVRTLSVSQRETNDEPTPKKPLESPIKLSKDRPGSLIFDADRADARPRRMSIGSSISDYPSLVSSPEMREPHGSSSNGTPLLLETPPPFKADYQKSDPVAPGSDHTLREDRLFRLDSQKLSPRTELTQNRNLSLPLQRFINERLELTFGDAIGGKTESTATTQGPSDVFSNLHPALKNCSLPSQAGRFSASGKNIRDSPSQSPEVTREESLKPGTGGIAKTLREAWEHTKSPGSTAPIPKAPAAPLEQFNAMRLKRQLTSHRSLESIGAYLPATRSSDETLSIPGFGFLKAASGSSTPTTQMRKSKDHLDEKISSILTALDARIHLVSADSEHDGQSTASHPMKQRERFRSISPQGSPARSSTPTPSLTITPAVSRRRYSHAHAPEESSVKLYHLHRGGKSAPTKLFVRSVGENGERVMVRVGGGWADLAEYLREFAVHHGRRHVSDTPLVEVQGLSRTSPTSPPRSRLAPAASGRRTPSRPPSVLSNRPASSLAVRKTRRTSNVSDMAEFRTSTICEALSASYSPLSTVSRRRLSTSSNASMGASSASEFRHGSSYSPSNTAAGAGTHTTPLGLAGPRPRHVSISAESEAWVEDVLGQARRSSSLRPYTYGLPLQEQEPVPDKAPVISKSRSISDLGTAGSSRRVALRGLGKR